MTDDQKCESPNHMKNCLKDEKPIWRENMWAASGSFSLFSFLHGLLQRGKGYEEVKRGDLAKSSLKFLKVRSLLIYGNVTCKYLKSPTK